MTKLQSIKINQIIATDIQKLQTSHTFQRSRLGGPFLTITTRVIQSLQTIILDQQHTQLGQFGYTFECCAVVAVKIEFFQVGELLAIEHVFKIAQLAVDKIENLGLLGGHCRR